MSSKYGNSTQVLQLLALVAGVAVLSGCGALKTIESAQIQSRENEEAEDRQFALDPHLVIVSVAPLKLGSNGPAPITNTYQHASTANLTLPEDPHRKSILAASNSRTLIQEFGLMAAFATMVYHRHMPVHERYALKPGQTSGANMEACTKNHATHPLPALMSKVGQLTSVTAGMARVTGQWERWLDGAEPACVSDGDLFYETYLFRRMDNGEVIDAIIAFRGTENTSEQIASDWKDNFSASMGVEPHQYKLAREKLKKTVAALKEVNSGKGNVPRIYAVGHSLGGGLAQMAAYTNQDILAAYAFNTSSVTDWSYLKPLNLVEVTDPVIYRIHQRGEFLGNLRAVTSRVNSRRFGRSDYEFNYQENGGEVAKHSISLLACHFAGVIAQQDPKSSFAFGYDNAFAAALFNHNLNEPKGNTETLCNPANRAKVCATSPALGSKMCGS